MEENIKPLSEIPAINRFLSYCRIRAVPSKTVVIHAGDLPDVLYYIISGSVEVMRESTSGRSPAWMTTVLEGTARMRQ